MSSGPDPYCTALHDGIRDIADGNGATRADVVATALERKDHALRIDLVLAVSWSMSVKTYPGRQGVDGSILCGSGPQVDAALDQALSAECVAERTVQRALAKAAQPMAALASLSPFAMNAATPDHYCHGGCGDCGGRGSRHCMNCIGGDVHCHACETTGKSLCSTCGGRGSVDESHWNEAWKCYSVRPVTCRGCGGARRTGTCGYCGGRGKQTCSACRGTTRIGCDTCARSGWLTHVATPTLAVSVERRWGLAEGAPAALGAFLRTLDLRQAPAHADLAHVRTEPGRGTARLVFAGTIPVAAGAFKVGPAAFSAVAAGKLTTIVALPPFLDTLLAPVTNRLIAGSSPDVVLRTAESSRLTAAMLRDLGAGAKVEPGAYVARLSGGVSESLIGAVAAALRKAYDQAGQSPVKTAWLLAALPLLAAFAWLAMVDAESAISDFFGRPALLEAPIAHLAWDLGAPLLLFHLARRRAGKAGRRALVRLLGREVRRSPAQGRWPLAVGLPAFALYFALLSVAHDGHGGQRHGVDSAEILALMQERVLGRTNHAAAQSDSALAAAAASAPPAPTPAAEPAGQPEGKAYAAEVQQALRDLGVYDGTVDGEFGPRSKAALEPVLAAIPVDQKDRYGQGVLAHVRAVRDDRIRLVLPAADHALVTAAARNATRLRFTDAATAAARDAFSKALRTPGDPVTWTAGEALAGSFLVRGDAADPARRGRACVRFLHGIRTPAGDDLGTEGVACRDQDRWTLQ